MRKLFFTTIWFFLLFQNYALAGIGSAFEGTPVKKILYIGVGCTLISYIVEAIGGGSWGKFIRISGLLSTIILVINEANKALSAIFSLG